MNAPSNIERTCGTSIVAAGLLTGLLVAVGCEPSLTVFTPSDQYHYSLFGVLNVAADTQIIRVEPLADSMQFGAPRTLDATVNLENLDTDMRVTLEDSVARVGARETQVHNFWTTHPIQAGTSYQLSVQRDGETMTTATITTPPRPPELSHDSTFFLPCVFPPSESRERTGNSFVITVQDVEAIAGADVIYPILLETPQGMVEQRRTFSHYESVMEVEGAFEVPIFYQQELVNLNPDPPSGLELECAGRDDFAHPYALVAVSAGGPNWPEWDGLPIDRIARPDSFSNVQGGHGFVGGIYSDTIRVPIVDRPS